MFGFPTHALVLAVETLGVLTRSCLRRSFPLVTAGLFLSVSFALEDGADDLFGTFLELVCRVGDDFGFSVFFWV